MDENIRFRAFGITDIGQVREHNEDAIGECDTLLQNIEEIIHELNNRELFEDIRIKSIDSDEGLVTPFGIADIVLEVRYS